MSGPRLSRRARFGPVGHGPAGSPGSRIRRARLVIVTCAASGPVRAEAPAVEGGAVPVAGQVAQQPVEHGGGVGVASRQIHQRAAEDHLAPRVHLAQPGGLAVPQPLQARLGLGELLLRPFELGLGHVVDLLPVRVRRTAPSHRLRKLPGRPNAVVPGRESHRHAIGVNRPAKPERSTTAQNTLLMTMTRNP